MTSRGDKQAAPLDEHNKLHRKTIMGQLLPDEKCQACWLGAGEGFAAAVAEDKK